MRYILFRGKRKIDDKWMEGSLVVTHFKDNKQPKYYITVFLGNYSFDHEVLPETIGQFIGSYDKEGKAIFEGDIIQVNPTAPCHVVYWNEDEMGWKIRCMDNSAVFNINAPLFRIVGNIFE